jgi:hypothetical protein
MTRPTASMVLAGLLAGLLAIGSAHAAQAGHVRASNAWIRVLPGNLPAGGYVTLRNDSDQPAILRGASSTAYAQIMLHQSSTAGGMSRMSMLDRLTIPAHGQLALAPAGYHLMLMDAAKPVRVGSTVRLSLQFGDGSTLATDFLARPANAE